MSTAVQDILDERRVQQEKFSDFDKTNSKNDWVSYVTAYAGRAASKVARNEREHLDFRNMMVKVGALAIAAVEAHDKGYC